MLAWTAERCQCVPAVAFFEKRHRQITRCRPCVVEASDWNSDALLNAGLAVADPAFGGELTIRGKFAPSEIRRQVPFIGLLTAEPMQGAPCAFSKGWFRHGGW